MSNLRASAPDFMPEDDSSAVAAATPAKSSVSEPVARLAPAPGTGSEAPVSYPSPSDSLPEAMATKADEENRVSTKAEGTTNTAIEQKSSTDAAKHPDDGNLVVFGHNATAYGYHSAAATTTMDGRMMPVKTYFGGNTVVGSYANNYNGGSVIGHNQSTLAAGDDPISEGRRIYIGNLKYSVNRFQVKRLLRQYGVYHTVEKIYMPYSEGPLEAPVDQHGYLADANVAYGYEEYQQQDGPPEMPNKGYVFVTYGDAREADAAIQRLGGVMHMDRKLVCRPGLPKGVAFRQDDLNGGAFRSHRRRRFERFDSILEDQYSGPHYSNSNNAIVSYGNGTYSANYGGGYANENSSMSYNGGNHHGPYQRGHHMGPAGGSYSGLGGNGYGNNTYGHSRADKDFSYDSCRSGNTGAFGPRGGNSSYNPHSSRYPRNY
ncbi:hypothetical protein PFICI_02060 [Pestalotiopsis fici W106-1]|uniref:RRM domain-containing protein n=1 Tax=Pestalotiopsis fici (strain W106-1 / CGMCC3.15140) TaxID=1229662 RepID=W3XRV4_PESFW|nr:uncharacterized protein PFICI_02060 [Pestalotiopsis fici W106-1]ETS88232.1 hypothetical protein PFICI_02060 [Pestalotiopsis fici W106-1]